jgi:hypothetical protein
MGGSVALIDKILRRLTALETELAAALGRVWRDRVLKNRPLEGEVGKVYLTRGKITGSSKNIILEGHVEEEQLRSMHEGVYEVVYQAKLHTGKKRYVLSLFSSQLGMVGKLVRIYRYNCIYHIGHYFVIGSNLEIYPVDYEIIKLERTGKS